MICRNKITFRNGKTGIIVALVPAQCNPFRIIERLGLKEKGISIKMHGKGKCEHLELRDEVSFIVLRVYNGKRFLTWPKRWTVEST